MIRLELATREYEEFWLSLDSHTDKAKLNRRIEEKRGFIIADGDTPIGIISYNDFWDDLPFLNLIKLVPQYRRRGAGKEAMSLFENELIKLGYRALLVSTQTDEQAQHFYRKIGYRECGCLVLATQPMEMFFIKTF